MVTINQVLAVTLLTVLLRPILIIQCSSPLLVCYKYYFQNKSYATPGTSSTLTTSVTSVYVLMYLLHISFKDVRT